MQAVIFCGAQASGKSTFFAQRFADTHVRINLDMLRTRRRELLLLGACIEGGQPFVVGNTNLTPDDRARYLGPSRAAGFRTVGYYFSSRLADCAARNALGAHCYWLLRKGGASARDATARLVGMSRSARNELLFAHGVNFNDLPAWQRRGFGLSFQSVEHEGKNPLTGEPQTTVRRRVFRDFELGMGADYDAYVAELVRQACEAPPAG